MDATTFQNLYFDLKSQYGLKASRRISVIEKVCMFLFELALGASNREVQEIFQHSGEIVSGYFNEVLKIICSLAVNIIKLEDPKFINIPYEIAMNPRYMSHFKVTNFFLSLMIWMTNLDNFRLITLKLMFVPSCFSCRRAIYGTHALACLSIKI
jgi:hypothetical protein